MSILEIKNTFAKLIYLYGITNSMKLSPLEEKLREVLVLARSEVVYQNEKRDVQNIAKEIVDIFRGPLKGLLQVKDMQREELELEKELRGVSLFKGSIISDDIFKDFKDDAASSNIPKGAELKQDQEWLEQTSGYLLKAFSKDDFIKKYALEKSRDYFATYEELNKAIEERLKRNFGAKLIALMENQKYYGKILANVKCIWIVSRRYHDGRLAYFLALAKTEGVERAVSNEALKGFHQSFYKTKEEYLEQRILKAKKKMDSLVKQCSKKMLTSVEKSIVPAISKIFNAVYGRAYNDALQEF